MLQATDVIAMRAPEFTFDKTEPHRTASRKFLGDEIMRVAAQLSEGARRWRANATSHSLWIQVVRTQHHADADIRTDGSRIRHYDAQARTSTPHRRPTWEAELGTCAAIDGSARSASGRIGAPISPACRETMVQKGEQGERYASLKNVVRLPQ
jgi:hypothetical protein